VTTNKEFATEPVTYQSSEFQPAVPIHLQSVLPSSPTELSTPILPSRIHPMVTRAQIGNLKPKTFFITRHPIPVCFLADLTAQPSEPSSYRQALRLPHWKKAMQDEMDALYANHTWTLVPKTSTMNLVSSKWIFKVKTQFDGTIDRYKARLVARGFTQLPRLDYDETFSPVVKPGTIRLIFNIGLSHGWLIRQLDVSNEFLHGDLHERVYLAQPPGFEDPAHPNHFCLLHKALYGLKQAPRAWYLKFSNYIQQMGYTRFYRQQGSNVLLLLIYVDDILLIGSSPSQISAFITHLSSMFHMKDLGDVHYFLGLQITRTDTALTITQTRYLLSLLHKFGLAGPKPVATPIASGTGDTIKELMSYPKCRSVEVINNPARSGSNHREVNYINYK
jgi:histone deacetylase 1/2